MTSSFMIEDILKKDKSETEYHYDDVSSTAMQNTNYAIDYSICTLQNINWSAQCPSCPVTMETELPPKTEDKIFTLPRKKRRVLFTREQTFELEKVFQRHQYLTLQQRYYLSKRIQLSSTQVKIWFQNHRYKLKKYFKDNAIEPPDTMARMRSEKRSLCGPSSSSRCHCSECAQPWHQM